MKKQTLKQELGFSKEQLTHMLSVLNTLIKQAKAGRLVKEHHGICELWWSRLNQTLIPNYVPNRRRFTTYYMVDMLARSWEHSAQAKQGNLYPIPGSVECCREDKWTGMQLDFRLDLMRHIARRLREWLRYMPKDTP